MGYCIELRRINDCTIKKDDIPKVVEALNKLGRSGERLSWIDTSRLATSTDIDELMYEIRWPGFVNDDGDFEIEYFSGEKYGSDEEVFKVLAPFFPDDAYIEMQGEEGELWRWIFKDGKCEEKSPTIIWD